MAPIEKLPPEIVSFIADLSARRPKSNFNRKGETNPRHFSALARTNRRFYAILNPLLYEHNFRYQPPFKSCVLWAVKRGNLNTLKRAHIYGADLNAGLGARPGRTEFLFTPLHLAIQLNELAIFNYLLDEGVELEPGSQHMCSCIMHGDASIFPLHTAIVHSKNPQYTETLIAKGCYRVAKESPAIAYIEDLDFYADSVAKLIERPEPFALAASLHHAVRKNKPDLVRDLLKRRGADITYTFHSKQTALHFALEYIQNDLEIIKLLLDHPGIDLSVVDNHHGVTPLGYCATRPELLDAAKLLVAHPDIQISCRNKDGSTPLHLAAASGSVSMFNLLASQPGIDFGATDADGRTVFHLALEYMADNIDVAKFLFQQPGISASAATNGGVTPLHLCALSPPLIEITKLLLNHPDVQPHGADWRGTTPLLNAAKSGSMDMFKLLFYQPGVRVSAADDDGNSALHFCAASPAMLEATKLLLEHPDINVTLLGTRGRSPLVCAARSGSLPMFELVAAHPSIDHGDEGPYALEAVCTIPETEETRSIVNFILDNANKYLVDDPDCPGVALHHAVARKNFETALLLLSRDADPNSSSVEMDKLWSDLHYSLEEPHPLQTKVVKALLAAGVGADHSSEQRLDSSVNMDYFPSDGTPLFFALIAAKNVECMKILLKAGADPDAMATSLESLSGIDKYAEQSMIAALCRHLWRTHDSYYLTEESLGSVQEGIVLLLEHGSSIGEVGEGVSALQFAADAAHSINERSLLNLFLDHATYKNIHPDDVDSILDRLEKSVDTDEAETIVALVRFKERLLKERSDNRD